MWRQIALNRYCPGETADYPASDMLTQKIETLNRLRSRIVELESEVAAERAMELAQLPAAYGFPTVKKFMTAVRRASRNGDQTTKKWIRHELRPAARKALGDELLAGKLTYAEARRKYKVSISTVYNVKQEAKRAAAGKK